MPTRRASPSFFSCLPYITTRATAVRNTRAISCASFPSPSTAADGNLRASICSKISHAAANGSTNTACSSLIASGTACKFSRGSAKYSANAPSCATIPSTVRRLQWVFSPCRQNSHFGVNPYAEHATLISPQTRRPIHFFRSLADRRSTSATSPTNSCPGVPRNWW